MANCYYCGKGFYTLSMGVRNGTEIVNFCGSCEDRYSIDRRDPNSPSWLRIALFAGIGVTIVALAVIHL